MRELEMNTAVMANNYENNSDKYMALGWIICALGTLFYCYEYILRIEPSVMMPALMHYFRIDAEGLGILSAVYYFAYTPMQLIVGVLTDIFGPRKTLTMAVAACAVGCLIFYHAHSVYVAVIGHIFIGFGSAFAFVGILKLAIIWLPINRFAMFSGVAS